MALDFAICREKHAIAEFQAIVRFTEPLDPTNFGDVSETAVRVAQRMKLPARVATPSFAVQFGPAEGARLPQPSINPLSLGFQRFAADGQIEERINVDPMSVSYVTKDYAGWPKTRELLAGALGEIAVPYAKQSLLIGTVQLQYSNEFTSVKDGFVAAQALFRKDTRWVPPIFAELDDLWHSHVGMFLPGDGFKNLVNVNVDVVSATTDERSGEFTGVKLLIIAARQFHAAGGRPLAVTTSEIPDILLANFDGAHDLEKSVLFETLSDPYLEAVNAR